MGMIGTPTKATMGNTDGMPVKDTCGTPFSQASTAPSTPFRFHLPDPLDYSFSRSISAQSRDALPEMVLEAICVSMQPLKSELGLWAQKQVEAEYWLRRHMPQEETFLVDNSELRAGTSGLAYRKSKRVDDRVADAQGPMWGCTVEGVDQGDGWLRVGDQYLPMALEGMCVLTPNPKILSVESDGDTEAEACEDGPAFTADGRVIDLDGGRAVFFSCERETSSSQSCKAVMIKAARASSGARLAQVAAEANAALEAEETCSIDLAGVVRGGAALDAAPPLFTTADRQKLFRRKWMARQGAQRGKTASSSKQAALCVDTNGKVFVFMHFADPAKRRSEKRAQAQQVWAKDHSVGVVIVDMNGIVRDRDEEE